MTRVLKNGFIKMPGANYEGMYPSMWPAIDEKWQAAFNHAYISAHSAPGRSGKERARWHRDLHYSFKKETES